MLIRSKVVSNPKLSKREMADRMERRVADQLSMGLTVNSGAYNDDADLKDNFSVAECKYISSKNINVSRIVFRKLTKQRKQWHRPMCFVATTIETSKDDEDDTFITIPLSMFARLYHAYKCPEQL